jgi:putative ABC transport system permease protein
MIIKTWLLDSVRNIKKRIVSWFSIVTIVLIGTTLILGLFFASSTVKKACVSYIYARNFKDFDITGSIGITEEYVTRIKNLPPINDAEGQISFTGVAALGENSAGVTVISKTERISVPTVIDGAMPVSPDECIVSPGTLDELGAAIGDEIEISISTARFSDVLAGKTFRITGLASHPDYMVKDKTNYVVLPESCFDTSELSFDYSNILVDADIPEDTFKSIYRDKSSEIKSIIEKETDEIAVYRVKSLNEELDKEYDSAKKKASDELAKGKAELDDATNLFNDTIAEAGDKLSQGEAELQNLKAQAEKELSEAQKKIKEGEEEYKKGIADGLKQLEGAERDMEKELDNARWQIFDGYLKIDEAEKLLNQKEEEYKKGKETYEKGKEKLKEGQKAIEEGEEMFDEAIEVLADEISPASIDELADKVKKYSREGHDRADTLSEEIRKLKDLEPLDRAVRLIDLYDEYKDDEFFLDIRKEIGDYIEELRTEVSALIEARKELDRRRHQYEEGKEQLKDGEEAIKEARQMLDEGWYELKKSKEKLAEGEAELAKREPEVRKQLEDAKLEFEQKKAEGAKQLEDAKKTLSEKTKEAEETIKKFEDEYSKALSEYNTQKADGEKQLKDGNAKYKEAEQEAHDKLEEIGRQIQEAKETPCSFMISTRDVNFPFVQTKSYIKAIDGFFSSFSPFYAGIIAIVCFFTMTIIVEEQTSQIGTSKAFGMYESEIMRKYIVFGTSGAIVGALLGVVGAFAIEKLLINTMKSNLAFSLEHVGHNVFVIVLLPVLEVLITVVAVIWSCHRYIRCSAVGLINGSEPVARFRKKSGLSFSKRIYTNLIINNLMTDIGREVVSVVTIVLCVFIVGFGIDIKMAYEGALDRQMNNIWKYDITLTVSGTATEEEKEAIKAALSGYETLNLPVTAGVITDGDAQILTSIICVDDKEAFDGFYELKDESGNKISVPDEGVLVTQEMHDKNSLSPGSRVSLISGNLKVSQVDVEGLFLLYAGKTMIMTCDYYEDHIGAVPEVNTYYIKTGKENADALKNSLSELEGIGKAELTRNLRDGNISVVYLYNTVVAIVIIFSIMLSFMILLNLSNILVAHRMREILTMRVNGFSKGEVIGYLVREVMVTVLVSVVIAVAIGMPSTGIIMKNMETDAFMFVRTPYVLAWAASVLINILFSVVINSIAFRKINKVQLTDINKY